MRLIWTRLAAADRKEIREYVALENPEAAINLDELFSVQGRHLVEHPDLGRPGRVNGTRELIVHRSYALVYDIAGTQVRLLRVLHTAREWPPG
ncbi:MAG: type II toxin-antitoxin system RelE/ParE family toxin [Stenotrophobium sp.]